MWTVYPLIEYCALRQKLVELEQYQHQCASAEGCAPATRCPVGDLFLREHRAHAGCRTPRPCRRED